MAGAAHLAGPAWPCERYDWRKLLQRSLVVAQLACCLPCSCRPEPKSDEKSEGIHLVIEIQRYENADFTVKCYSYWEHDPPVRIARPRHQPGGVKDTDPKSWSAKWCKNRDR